MPAPTLSMKSTSDPSASSATSGRRSYREHVAAVAERQHALTREAQEVGEFPAIVNPDRREACATDFPLFCRTYFPRTFTLPWAPFHMSAANKITRAIRRGGQFAFAMPRGQGKSSLCEAAAMWATIYGLRNYVVIVGATQADAEIRLANIKTELEGNPLLMEDFPEACKPIWHLERSTRRCQGQKYQGRSTGIEWGKDSIRLAEIGDYPCSGAIIESAGITGRIRGRVHKLPDGRSVRPGLAIVDDPQTRESSKSETKCRDREAMVAGDIAYLAGPDEPMAIVMPCTVIYRDDVADRFLNRTLHPEWQGERTKMVLSWPTEESLWAEYQQIWRTDLINGGDGSSATEFYLARQPQMDAGAVVSWPQRTGGHASAIEHVMRLRMTDEASFLAEYQNEPLEQEQSSLATTVQHIITKTNGMEQDAVPLDAVTITAGIDVQQTLLYWCVVAWRTDFSGYVLNYGTTPKQQSRDFTLQTARRTLDNEYPTAGLEGRLYAGLQELSETVLSRKWIRDGDGTELPLERAIIDANWAQSTQLVYQFCREWNRAGVLYPGHGKGIGAGATPWSDYQQRPGERLGHHWRIPPVKRTRPARYVVYDTNYWKSFTHTRWITALGDPGCLTLYGKREGRGVGSLEHINFAGHQCAEYPVRTEGRGRVVDEWKLKPGRPNNHWLDCLVAASVAASMAGISMVGTEVQKLKTHSLPRITREYLNALGR